MSGRRVARALRRAVARVEDSWAGDVLGAASLFGLLWLGLWAVEVLR